MQVSLFRFEVVKALLELLEMRVRSRPRLAARATGSAGALRTALALFQIAGGLGSCSHQQVSLLVSCLFRHLLFHVHVLRSLGPFQLLAGDSLRPCFDLLGHIAEQVVIIVPFRALFGNFLDFVAAKIARIHVFAADRDVHQAILRWMRGLLPGHASRGTLLKQAHVLA